MDVIRLTQTVQKGGCAAKVPALELRKILSTVPFPPTSPELLIDGKDFDDAAIYQLSSSQAMVQTLDFFTPILDSPFAFGQVAAANALSDVYAMGGRPITALAILAFPSAVLSNAVISQVLAGACEILTKAKTALAGGHSIDDDTLKFGLSVTGLVHPEKIWTNKGAQTGDRLILTKALGTGALSAALKRNALSENEIQPAIDSMTQLNNIIDLLEPLGFDRAIHAATDITGFGLSGHATQMARASGQAMRISHRDLPRLPRAEECLQREFLTKAHRTNREYTSEFLRLPKHGFSVTDELLLHDPQTSGGLLISVDQNKVNEVYHLLKTSFEYASIIGEVCEGPKGQLEIV